MRESGQPDVPPQVARQAYLNFRDWANQNATNFPAKLSVDQSQMARRFIEKVHNSCSRAYFSTVGGRLGLGPRNMAAGDLVCIVYGAKVPYILRPRPAGTEMEFIGDSYVDGVMYGESLMFGKESEVFSID